MNVSGKGIAIAVAVLVALGLFVLFAPATSPFSSMSEVATGTFSTNATSSMDLPLDPSQSSSTDLVITDVVVGTGAEATLGSIIAVHYTGTLPDGTVFDSSIPRGEPFVFQLGAGQVISGWDQGVAGMKVGGKRTLVIPPDLAYGPQAVGNIIPANATLMFEVELIAVQ